jgi:hypothetical protein
MIDKDTARALVAAHIKKMENEMNAFGSALPGYADRPKSHLMILDEYTQEHEFGWVFFYNTREYVVDGDFAHALGGNAPLIADKSDGKLYVTGTAHDIDYYLEEYRRGRRTPAEQSPGHVRK